MKCAPYHPSSTGFAECFIRNFKQTECNLERWPDSATQVGKHPTHLLCGNTYYHRVSPSTLFLGQEVCTRLDLLAPQLESGVSQKQASQRCNIIIKPSSKSSRLDRKLWPGTSGQDLSMLIVILLRTKGPSSYLVIVMELSSRHIDHLKILQSKGQQDQDQHEDIEPDQLVPDEGDSFPYSSPPKGTPWAAGCQPQAPPLWQYSQRSHTIPNWYGRVVTQTKLLSGEECGGLVSLMCIFV